MALNKFSHAVTSGYVLASVFVVGISAWFLLRGRHREMAKASIKVASVFGIITSILLAISGDRSAKLVARVQPMKLAAMEALYDGETGAGLTVISILRPESERTDNENAQTLQIRIPKLLSIMSFGDPDAFVAGINDLIDGSEEHGILSTYEKMERGRYAIAELARYRDAKSSGDQQVIDEVIDKFNPDTPEGKAFLSTYFKYFGYGYMEDARDVIPNVPLVFYSFRVMVGLGFYFILLFAVAIYLPWKDRLEKRRWILHLMLWSIPLAYLAGQAGWVVTEVGRQPWTIQDLLPTVAAVSRLDVASVKVTFFLFVILFTTLLIAEIMIMKKQIQLGPDKMTDDNGNPTDGDTDNLEP